MSKSITLFLFILITCLLLSASTSAQPERPAKTNTSQTTFNVDSTADLGDTSPGNGLCQASNGLCTLRAAVEETNALAGMDTIHIPAGTYALDSQLVIHDSLFFTGAGRTATILDGQDDTPILKIRTLELLVCDSGNNSVASYDPNGQRNVDFLSSGQGGMDVPGAIAIGPSNDVFVTAFSSGVHRFSSDGHNEGLFVDPDDFLPDVFAPTDGIFGGFPEAPNLDFYVADYFPGNRILRIDRFGGNVVDTINGGGLAQPNNLAFHDDDLFVTSVGSDQVLRYDGDNGNFISVFVPKFPSGSPVPLDRPRGLVFKGSSLYVANENTNSVLKFNASTGAYQSVFVSAGSGGLDKPSDLVFGPDGDLYVISRGNKSILRYNGSSGAFKETFVEGGDIFLENPSCLAWRSGAGEGPIVNISQMTLQNGRSAVGGDTAGLDIDQGASVSFSDGVIRDNESSQFGGGIQNWGSLDLRDMEITGNTLPEGGGGQTSQGGGIFNTGNLDMKRVSVTHNFASRGGGISNINDGRVEMTNSTISGNTSFGAGGGIRNVVDGRLFINHSTIVDNEINGPGSGDEPERLGAGIYNSSTAYVDIANSILAENDDNRSKFEGDYAPDCWSATNFHFTSHGRNIIGIINGNCTYNSGAGDLTGSNDNPRDPQLGSLFNGVHNPFPGSPVVDGGSSVVSDPIFFDYGCRPEDQLGHPRPIDGDTNGSEKCDIGAVEFLPPNDNDNVDAAVEDGAPNGGDGNNDGIPDSLQPRVASFVSAENQKYVTIVSPSGTTLQDVQALKNDGSSPGPNLLLPFGRFNFSVNYLPAGSSLPVAIILPEGYTADAYYKLGKTADKKDAHWYEFMYDGTSGARIAGSQITVIFVDGKRGDDDLSANRRVVDPGAPVVILDERLHMPVIRKP